MHNPWVGEHRGDHSPLVRISPLMYPQRKLMNMFFLPKLRDLPQEGLELKGVVFDFGFNATNPSKQLQPFDTQYSQDVLERNFLLWAIVMIASTPPNPIGPPALARPAFIPPPGVVLGSMFQIFHTHEGVQRQFATKWVTDVESAGTAQHPFILTRPYLFLKQDTISCEMKNTSASILNAQLVLWGGEFD